MRLGAKFWRTLSSRQRFHAVLLIIAVIGMAALEVFNVSALAPFLSLVADPDMVEHNQVLAFVYDRFGFQDVTSFIIACGLGVFALLLFANGWAAVTTWAQLRFVWSWNHQVSSRLLDRYMYRPYDFFLNQNSADLSKNLLSEVQQISNRMVKPVILAIGKGAVALGIVTVLVVVNPALAVLVSLVVGGSFGIIYLAVRKRLGSIGHDRMQANAERFTIAGEALGGIKEVKMHHVERDFSTRFRRSSGRFSRHQATSQSIATLPRYAIEAVAFGTVIIIVVYMVAYEHDFAGLIPILGMYAFAGYRLMPALQQVFTGVAQGKFFAPALDAVLKDLEREEESAPAPERDHEVVTFNERLHLENVSFTYPGADRRAISDVSLTIPANSVIGLIGATGSGKSTLVDLILGLLRPQAGKIVVDGVAISDRNLASWQLQIGYVPQQIFLRDASVAENIAFGIPKDEIDMEAVRSAARIAQLDDFVMRELPDQYDTMVGERGVRLSGGQRQRIGIARALYRDPSLVVFDEATSALDTATEELVMESMRALRGRKTIIMVAHRLTTLRDCDEVYVVENGRIVSSGPYESIIKDGREGLEAVERVRGQ